MTDTPNTPTRKTRSWASRHWKLLGYLALLLASALFQRLHHEPPAPLPSTAKRVTLPAMADEGPVPGQQTEVVVYDWPAPVPRAVPPVLLIHGSPGQGADFAKLAQKLNEAGYRVLAPDLPGFGHSAKHVPSMSMRANARTMSALLDAMQVPRAHVVGWSNGGGVALHLADEERGKVASVTLLASVGMQEFEGSGSYRFEHAKYALGYLVFGGVPELLPHFGLLGSYSQRTAWLRNFWDSDQRRIRDVLARLNTARPALPVLILHGRYDVLVPWRTADATHKKLTGSTLIYIRANHFLPIAQTFATSQHLVAFFRRHEEPGSLPIPGEFDFAPPRPRTGLLKLVEPIERATRSTPWWGQTSLLGKAALVWPTGAMVGVALLVSAADLDPFVGFVAIFLGLCGQTFTLTLLGRTLGAPWGRWLYRVPIVGAWSDKIFRHSSKKDWSVRLARRPAHEGWLSILIPGRRMSSLVGAAAAGGPWSSLLVFLAARLAASVAWSLMVYIISLVGVALLVRPLDQRYGLLGGMLALVPLAIAILVLPLLPLVSGRRALLAFTGRLFHHEYWPAWLFYAPLFVYGAWLSLRHRGVTVFTCCNPGIESGGGIAGESKSAIMAALGDSPLVLPTHLIGPGLPQERVRSLALLMESHEAIRCFPVILKPDAGERGYGLRLIHTHDDALRYFQQFHTPTVVQPYHAGPHECGVLWIRRPESLEPGATGPQGFVYSLTRKQFPFVVGDGQSTIEELIEAHPRFRRQARVFLWRFRDRASEVPARGEAVRLGVSGNHAQGTMFLEGADLVTPELAAAIDRLAAGFKGGLDVGRFDIRYADETALRRGEGFGVLELNGVTSESTNLYDPNCSLGRAYAILFGQWRRAYELGELRQRQGRVPMRVGELLRTVRRHTRSKTGDPVAD